MDEYEEAVLFTFALLESRLARLEYVLGRGGEDIKGGESDGRARTVVERMHRIDKSLHELSARTALLNDAKQMLTKHEALIKPAEDKENAGLDTAQKAAMVVERAPSFASTASQLKALDDQQLPQTDGFTKLARLLPRIAEAEDRHLQQALEISLLRRQSGLLVQRVKQVQLVGAGRCWAAWQGRLAKAQRTVGRMEFSIKQEQAEEPGVLRGEGQQDSEDEDEEDSEEDEEDEL